MAWSTSTRRHRLPADWERIRQATKARAGGQCEWSEDGARCPEPGTDCDHVEAMTDDHSRTQWLCRKHHAIKSAREGRQAQLRAKREAKKRFARPVEEHPGRVAAREGFRPPDFKSLEDQCT